MRHRVKKHLHLGGKDKAHRKSVIRSLISGLFEHKSIVTTQKRALAMTGVAEKLIEVAKSDATEYIEVAANYTDRQGGYTRITPIKYRDGDSALLVKIELV